MKIISCYHQNTVFQYLFVNKGWMQIFMIFTVVGYYINKIKTAFINNALISN